MSSLPLPVLPGYPALDFFWRGVRAVEGARLESVCTSKAYRGFESLPLRHSVRSEQPVLQLPEKGLFAGALLPQPELETREAPDKFPSAAVRAATTSSRELKAHFEFRFPRKPVSFRVGALSEQHFNNIKISATHCIHERGISEVFLRLVRAAAAEGRLPPHALAASPVYVEFARVLDQLGLTAELAQPSP